MILNSSAVSDVVSSRLTVLLLLALSLLTLPGCFILPLEPKTKGIATDQYRLEMEFLPNARMVREDTSPWWDLGRMAFVEGTDRIIILGRTTSYADKDEDYNPIPGTMRDRKLERVWITIRSDVPLGKAQKLEDMEIEFLTGYDVNNLDSKGFFNGPALMKGFINLVEESPDKVVVVFDLEVRPNKPFQAENWKIEGKHTIPVVPEGRIATKAVSRDVQVTAQGTPLAPQTTPVTPVATPLVPPTLDNGEPKNPKIGDGNGETTTPVVSKELPVKSVVGKWSYDTPGFDYRFQFGDNGKFIYSSTRGDGVNDGYDAMMAAGTYEIKRSKTSEWVVLVIDRDNFGGFKGEDRTALFRLEWDGDNPVLTGEHSITRSPKAVRFVCKQGGWQDMNQVLPPRGRRKDLPPEKNPNPFW